MAGVSEAAEGLEGHLATDGAALLGAGQWPVCRRSHTRLADWPLPWPERQHACLRSDARGLRCDPRRQVPAVRWCWPSPSPGGSQRWPTGWCGSTTASKPTEAGRSTGTTTTPTRPTSSGPVATRPVT
jgi:hypothetical protein